MPFSIAILTLTLSWTWLLERRAPGDGVLVIGGAVIALTAWHSVRTGEWGGAARALPSATLRATLVTVPAVLLIIGAGWALGTLHDRRDFLGSFVPLTLWGGAQQWVLQTVLLREAQQFTSRRGGIVLAALLFGVAHLPNPVLTPVTIAGALCWCAIYDRHPNILPLAVSQSLGTLALLHAFDPATLGRLRVGAAYLQLGQP